jgi:ATP-dependent DNA helicase 2 subunit 2
VPPRVKGTKRVREQVKPLSELDIDALLGPREKRRKITSENAIPEFKQMMKEPDNLEIIDAAVKELGCIIRDLIKGSQGSSKYDQAISMISVMRSELVLCDEPELFNDFMLDLKKKILTTLEFGNRASFFTRLKENSLGLISSEVNDDIKPERGASAAEVATVCRTSHVR